MLFVGIAASAVCIWAGAPWWLSVLAGLVVAWAALTSIARWFCLFAIFAAGAGLWTGAPWWASVAIIAVVAVVCVIAALEAADAAWRPAWNLED